MIVLDASALLELLLETPRGRHIASRIADPAESLHIPHIADIEITQALRRLVRSGDLEPTDAATALNDLRALDLERHSHESLLDRIWQLRDNLSAYDATYVALAEALDGVLLTSDRKLLNAPHVGGRAELVE